MRHGRLVNVVMPALNEEQAIPRVLAAIPAWVDRIIVVDNGSTDRTAEVAAAGGATVVREARRGYGSACLAGVAAAENAEVIVFLDADCSDDPGIMHTLVDPIARGEADMVIGSRVLGQAEPGSLTATQRFGNALACTLMRISFGARHTDLGPFRAVSAAALKRMRMTDTTYGWTVQMQIRAARLGLRVMEVPVPYRRRVGRSKISGTIRGFVGAGSKILSTIAVESWHHRVGRDLHQARQRLLIFARFPEPGQTKTRLVSLLGDSGAAQLHAQMIRQCVHVSARLREVAAELWHSGGNDAQWRDLIGDSPALQAQCEGDLGRRMCHAFDRSFARGDEAVIAIGTDCPFITLGVLRDAYRRLRRADVVIGPSVDGGYYLLGLRRAEPELFSDIAWSTEHVLAQTLAKAAALGLSVEQLPTLTDIDNPADLAAFDSTSKKEPAITVIIAATERTECIAATIASATNAGHVEIVVVETEGHGDAEKRRVTGEIAQLMGARTVHATVGTWMAAGAAEARGRVLVFLKGEATLPPRFAAIIRRGMMRRRAIAGLLPLQGRGGRLRILRNRPASAGWPFTDGHAFFIRRADSR